MHVSACGKFCLGLRSWIATLILIVASFGAVAGLKYWQKGETLKQIEKLEGMTPAEREEAEKSGSYYD